MKRQPLSSLSILGLSVFNCLAVTIGLTINPIVVQAQGLTTTETTLIAQSNRTRRIQFKPGTTSSLVQDAVVRGTRDIYLLGARAAQTMNISLSSVENNAVFDLVTPNGVMIKQGVTSASLVLPLNGDYKVIVGGTRGNATYQLYVEIK